MGNAIEGGGVRFDDLAVVYGIGGIGINAVQGAAFAGVKFEPGLTSTIYG